ncbi:transcription termination factor Rho [Phycisphaera mikurensis]|uniref:Transcription termination factor Rho n=1 Tax=Phycisphaera mikurensis (strain NBRC 102666 / KCTC 22515 / FYK2301M01) TaxID=1142394 RepID=I0ICA7_PHYMF|nr:transcription termination factor Rho [Phycisphaera mikurensis]BAM02895.1 transcription termination factor Rho [Phycisphaera mikurensis NBRC 102666]
MARSPKKPEPDADTPEAPAAEAPAKKPRKKSPRKKAPAAASAEREPVARADDPGIRAAEAAVAEHEADQRKAEEARDAEGEASDKPAKPRVSGSTDEQLEEETQNRYENAKRDELTIRDLQDLPVGELRDRAEIAGIDGYGTLGKSQLLSALLNKHAARHGLMYGEGVLEVLPDGFGFLRSPDNHYLACPDDIYVSPSQIRRFGLKMGHEVHGTIRPPKESERYFALLRVDAINGAHPQDLSDKTPFESLEARHPTQRFLMESPGEGSEDAEMRIVDLVAPVGKGQRSLIVAPARTGKTRLMQMMATSIVENNTNTRVFVVLIDERPEEISDWKKAVPESVEIVASTFDESPARHVQVCEMVIERARRMVEYGFDVVVMMDSMTRMARGYHADHPHSGRTMQGGLDAQAMQRPKKFFASARDVEGGGSLSIIATALKDTGVKVDEVIFDMFKQTANSEIHLDRRLAERRLFPAIDIAASGTRREELLMDRTELRLVNRLRKVLSDMNIVEAMELLKSRLGKYRSNAEFLLSMSKE